MLVAATAASPGAPTDRSTPAAAPRNLGSAAFDWARLAAVPTKSGERRDILDSPTPTLARLESHVTTLRPGEAPHASHAHPDEEIVIVKEGGLEVTIGDRVEHVGPGSMIFFASNEPHGVRNAGETPATYYIIRILARGAAR